MTTRATIAAAAREAVAALQDAQQARRRLEDVLFHLKSARGFDPASADGKTLACLLHGVTRCHAGIHVAITQVPENAWRHWLREDCYAGVVETAESLDVERLQLGRLTGHGPNDPLRNPPERIVLEHGACDLSDHALETFAAGGFQALRTNLQVPA